MSILLRDVEVGGRPADVRCAGGLVAEIAGRPDRLEARPGEEVLDGGGGALLPGLHDHHLHLLAWAAALESIDLGPTAVARPDDLDRILTAARPGRDGWVRAVAYDERTGGELDRRRLDRLVADRPVRVQHRSGHLWVLNGVACAAVGFDAADGRLYDGDRWLAERVGDRSVPDLGAVGRRLTGFGVTGVTDLTPSTARSDWEVLAVARASGAVPQRVVVAGSVELVHSAVPAGLDRGPTKVVVSDHDVPDVDELAATIATAHRAGSAVALHCVTRVSAAVAVAAWRAAGPAPGDRMEHGAVLDDDLAGAVARLGLAVVTQPAFVAERGDRYRAEVDADDVAHLYRCQGLLDHGIPLGGSTDAPYGPADPWRAMVAAVDRRAASGAVLGAGERLTPRRALELFLAAPADPGGPPRTVRAGAPADLCLLDAPLATVLADLDAGRVAATLVDGIVVGP